MDGRKSWGKREKEGNVVIVRRHGSTQVNAGQTWFAWDVAVLSRLRRIPMKRGLRGTLPCSLLRSFFRRGASSFQFEIHDALHYYWVKIRATTVAIRCAFILKTRTVGGCSEFAVMATNSLTLAFDVRTKTSAMSFLVLHVVRRTSPNCNHSIVHTQ